MSKILLILFFIFSFIFQVNANSDIKIITRAEWWANESYRYLDSLEWINIIKKRNNTSKLHLTEKQKKNLEKKALKVKKANRFLINNYWDLIWISNTINYENWHKLAWPISHSKKKYAIVVHHTHSEYKNSYEGVRQIYKYHALTREWWDIGYNYLIWYNWEIFEWRAWWDYTIWAHVKWNNQWTIWIALIWDYDKKNASEKQLKSLEKLIKYLQKKYKIDFSEKKTFFKWCIFGDCDKKPLVVEKQYPLIWHRDAWHTNCPWDKLYSEIIKIRNNLKNISIINKLKERRKAILEKKYLNFLKKMQNNKRLWLLVKIEKYLDIVNNKNISNKKIDTLKLLKKLILSINKNNSENKEEENLSFNLIKYFLF